MTRTSRHGFTILELALAMAFISFLVLLVGVATAQIASLYQRGVVLSQVNDNGRELVDELTRGIEASIYANDEISGLEDFYFEYSENLSEQIGIEKEVPLYGAFCTGLYSYIWNTGYALGLEENVLLENSTLATTWQSDDETETIEKFRMLRVGDSGRKVCKNYKEATKDGLKTSQLHGGGAAVELLPASTNELVLYDLKTFTPAYDKYTRTALYSVTFILGTVGGGTDITASGDFCKVGYGGGFITDFTYCAVNKFNFAARAIGGISYEN